MPPSTLFTTKFFQGVGFKISVAADIAGHSVHYRINGQEIINLVCNPSAQQELQSLVFKELRTFNSSTCVI